VYEALTVGRDAEGARAKARIGAMTREKILHLVAHVGARSDPNSPLLQVGHEHHRN
jgi:hypothetical protein